MTAATTQKGLRRVKAAAPPTACAAGQSKIVSTSTVCEGHPTNEEEVVVEACDCVEADGLLDWACRSADVVQEDEYCCDGVLGATFEAGVCTAPDTCANVGCQAPPICSADEALHTAKGECCETCHNRSSTAASTTAAPKRGGTKLFLVAGQSNAEGNVKMSGLRGILSAMPAGKPDTEPLTTSERTALRQAVLEGRGFMCDEAVEDVVAADVVIDALRASASGWQAMADSGPDWAHSSATIVASNFRFRQVNLVSKADVGEGGGGGDGISDYDYCLPLCMAYFEADGDGNGRDLDGSTGCYDPFCGSNQIMSCSQGCKARRAGATEAECLGVCEGDNACAFELAGLQFPACSSCGIAEGYEHACTINSDRGCRHGCTVASGRSGAVEDAEQISNKCAASPADSIRVGPALSQYTPTGAHPLAAGFGALRDDELTYGPELAFGKVLGDTLAAQTTIVKVAMGGSNLADHWRTGGTLYNTLVAEAKAALLATNNSEYGGFLWFQGFNDQFDDVWCRGDVMDVQYEQNLKGLIASLRSDLGSPELPVVVVRARNGGEAMRNIQTAQEAVAADDAHVRLVHSHDTSECFHYDSGAQVVIGERAAQAMLDLLRN
jgi:hypothetical protein